ncbi:MAG: DNA primase small subunit domain-containing protein [Thermoplasmata archaeon]
MAKTVPLDPRTLQWARHLFARYYRSTPIAPPARLARREFAAFPFAEQTLMRRHATLRSAEEFHTFLGREAPRHVYYSSAYYRHPADPRMADKDWLGADLIFDLDSDHLRGAAERDYPGQLRLVKERLKQLLDDFLFGDFGVDPTQTSLVFSGGRGYHVHVHDPLFQSLTSPERRELVEYVLGMGYDPLSAVEEVREGDVGAGDSDGAAPSDGWGSSTGRRHRARSFKRLPAPDAPGWKGRTTRAVIRLLEHWEAIGAQGATRELIRMNVDEVRARRWAKWLVTYEGGRRIRETRSLEVFPKEVPKDFLDVVLPQAAIELQGETDAPVTTDVHRLIRLPDSLHGGTGFRAKAIDRESLDAFDPWRDALFPAPADERFSVQLTESIRYPFQPDDIAGNAGETVDVVTPAALFLVLRGEAVLPPEPA